MRPEKGGIGEVRGSVSSYSTIDYDYDDELRSNYKPIANRNS